MPTLAAYRERFARELGPFHEGTAKTGSTASILIDTDYPVFSSIDQGTMFVDHILFRPSAALATDKLRVVKTYTPSSGSLAVDQAWTNAPANGEAYELHGVIPPDLAHQLINEALGELLIEDELTLTPTAQQTRHSLASLAWLRDRRWVRQVGWLHSSENREQTNPFTRVMRGEVTRDADVFHLVHPGQTFDSGETLYLRVIRPAYGLCRPSAGTFGGQSGLSLETDEALPSENLVAAQALIIAWRRFSQLLDQSASGGLTRSRVEVAEWLTKLASEELVVPEQTLAPPVRLWGPGSAGRAYGPMYRGRL